jgi:hypothetical protein
MYVEWSEAELRKQFSRHSLLPTILIPFYSPRLSSDLF